MKKVKTLIGLLILLSLIYTIPPTSSARIDALTGPAFESTLVENVPENATVLNTTNPDASYNSDPLDERYSEEGPRPLNVLIFADEEAQLEEHWVGLKFGGGRDLIPVYKNWEDYLVWQIERGDETLVAEFGIDIRVIDALTWDSDDSKEWFRDLLYELWYEEGVPYLRGEYNGVWIDAIIGVTAQETCEAEKVGYVVYGQTNQYLGVILLRWKAYWADDNLVQHEVSHLYWAEDVENEWSVMSYDVSFRDHVEEEGYWWWLWDTVGVAFLTNDYCSYNYAIIDAHKDRFPHPLGDADFDGDVDMDDFYVWYQYWGTPPEEWGPHVDPDFDNDGDVDTTDLYIWLQNVESVEFHDVAVTSVSASPTSVRVGDTVTITAVVENQGTYTETFQVRAYADTTLIGTKTVTDLPAKASRTLTFTWNTGVPSGTYTISAEANVVPGENEPFTADNTYTDGTVEVCLQLTVLAFVFQNGTWVPLADESARGYVYIDGQYRGRTCSTFLVLGGTREVLVTDFWGNRSAGEENFGWRYTFQYWNDSLGLSTDNPRNITVAEDMTIKAHFYKKWCPGDVDGDGKVGYLDQFALADAYNSHYGDPNYDSRCDFDNDGKVGYLDCFILADNYGHTYP